MKKRKFRLPRKIKKLMTGIIDNWDNDVLIGDVVKVSYNYPTEDGNGCIEVNGFLTHVYKDCGNAMVKFPFSMSDKKIQIHKLVVFNYLSRNNKYRNSLKYNRQIKSLPAILSRAVNLKHSSHNKFEAFDEFINEAAKHGGTFEVRLNFNGHDLADWATGNY